MSQGYGQKFDQDQGHEPLAWERVTWRQGDGRYVFEVAEGGLHATLRSPHDTSLTLPMVAWEGLLDALAGAGLVVRRAAAVTLTHEGFALADAVTRHVVGALRIS